MFFLCLHSSQTTLLLPSSITMERQVNGISLSGLSMLSMSVFLNRLNGQYSSILWEGLLFVLFVVLIRFHRML